MLVADIANSTQQRFEAVLGVRRGSGRPGQDAGEPQGILFDEAEAAELLRQVVRHGFSLVPARFLPITLDRHPWSSGESLYIIAGDYIGHDNMKAAVVSAARIGPLSPGHTSEHFVVIIFTDRENGTSVILDASGKVMLSAPTTPAV
jgi:hypothetical protein